MWLPVLRGFLDRRVLVNYRIDPVFMQKCLPPPFRPQIVNGYGMAGVCLIRMNRIGPRTLPFPLVRSTENGALRFAVEWEQAGDLRRGVYIPARYTTSRLAAFAGTRLFPGRHYLARFVVEETPDRFRIQLDSPQLQLRVSAHSTEAFTGSKVFASLDQASAFFHSGAHGFSESRHAGAFDGVELRIYDWKVSPLAVEQLECDFFDDKQRFPAGTAELDNALLMRGLNNEFHGLPSFCCMQPAEHRPEAPVAS